MSRIWDYFFWYPYEITDSLKIKYKQGCESSGTLINILSLKTIKWILTISKESFNADASLIQVYLF